MLILTSTLGTRDLPRAAHVAEPSRPRSHINCFFLSGSCKKSSQLPQPRACCLRGIRISVDSDYCMVIRTRLGRIQGSLTQYSLIYAGMG